jgi:hypothetical protein
MPSSWAWPTVAEAAAIAATAIIPIQVRFMRFSAIDDTSIDRPLG